jgi:uncharacterized protein YdeI (YjbR/CyaY-like superfamily)
MATKDPRVDEYIAKAAPFAKPILIHLRKIVHAGCPEVRETIKWSFPHFDHKGVMCGMAAFQRHCSFGFWKESLLFEGHPVAEKEAMGHFGRITSIADLPPRDALISHVRKAAALNEKGINAPGRTQPRKRPPLKTPAYLTAALNRNPKAKKTFVNLSPSHRREYIEWITEAKREETRRHRLATAIEWLAAGKPRNWKYQPATNR